MPFVAIRARGPVRQTVEAVKVAQGLAARHAVFLQLVDPAIVYNERHLEAAWTHAERARREDRMTAHTLEAEFLMYLTGQRQVSNALPLAGIRDGLADVIVCAAGERAGAAVWGLLDKLGWSRVPSGVGINPDAVRRLGCDLSQTEAEDAVLEKVALVDLVK